MTLTSWLRADAELKIYRFSGDVTMTDGKSRSAVQRRSVVKSSDRLAISKGGKVEILDTDTRRIYSPSVDSGIFTVAELMDRARKEADNVTRNTNRHVLAAVKDNAGTQWGGYGRSGVSHHETDADPLAMTALPEGMTYLTYLMGLAPEEDYDDRHDIVLIRRDYPEGDDTFNFAVFNTLDHPVYFNVIDQKPDGKITLYFDSNPIAEPKSETLIGQYRFLLPDETAGYIIIASEADFSAEDVNLLLNPQNKLSQDFYFSLLRI